MKISSAGKIVLLAILAAAPLSSCAQQGTASPYHVYRASRNGKEYFLAALSDRAVNSTSQALTELDPDRLLSSRYYLQNREYIDAEKTDDSESKMCWAACAANMLTAAGWTAGRSDPKTGTPLDTEDAVMAYYASHFDNETGTVRDALKWFFEKTGVTDPPSISSLFVSSHPEQLYDALDMLEDGSAISIAVSYVNNKSGAVTKNHSLTVYGYVKDAADPSDIMLFAADSDDSVSQKREDCDNRYRILNIRLVKREGKDTWILDRAGNESDTAYLEEVCVLESRCIDSSCKDFLDTVCHCLQNDTTGSRSRVKDTSGAFAETAGAPVPCHKILR